MEKSQAKEIAQDVVLKNQDNKKPLPYFELLTETIHIYETRIEKECLSQKEKQVIRWLYSKIVKDITVDKFWEEVRKTWSQSIIDSLRGKVK